MYPHGNPYSPYSPLGAPRPPEPPRKEGPNVLYWVLAVCGVGFVMLVCLFFAVVLFKGYMDVKMASAPPVTSAGPGGGGLGAVDEEEEEEDDDLPPLGAHKLPSIKRDIPHHDVKLLSGCSDAELRSVLDQIDDAVAVGAPRYNHGDFQGCYDEYVNTALDIEGDLPKTCAGPASALKAGRDKAAKLTTSSERAWAMRDAFDGLIDVIERRGTSL